MKQGKDSLIEISANGNSYAASNKVKETAKEKVMRECLKVELKDQNCNDLKCFEL